MRHAITIALLLTLVVACGQKEEVATQTAPPPRAQTVAAHSMTPEQLGELGAQISRQPEKAVDLLTQHGLTAETFEKQIRRVTEDPQASRRYADAYKRSNT